MIIDSEQYLKVKEVAAYLRISDQTVYRLIHGKTLIAIRVGRSFRVSVKSADAYLKAISTETREETL